MKIFQILTLTLLTLSTTLAMQDVPSSTGQPNDPSTLKQTEQPESLQDLKQTLRKSIDRLVEENDALRRQLGLESISSARASHLSSLFSAQEAPLQPDSVETEVDFVERIFADFRNTVREAFRGLKNENRDLKELLKKSEEEQPSSLPDWSAIIKTEYHLLKVDPSLPDFEGDIDEANNLYFSAAMNSQPLALMKIALLRECEGNTVEAKEICALLWSRIGYQSALFPLGRMLEKEGKIEEAEILYAFAHSNFGAISRLKEMKQEGKLKHTKEWFTLTSQDAGDKEYMLGLLAEEKGRFKEQQKHLTIAVQKGHPDAMVLFGIINSIPFNADRNEKEALRLFQQAHDSGYIPGTFHLGEMLIREGQAEQGHKLCAFAQSKGYPIERSRIEDILNNIVPLADAFLI